MNDNDLYALFWKLLAVCIIIISVSCNIKDAVVTSSNNIALNKMVSKGIEAKKAGCTVAIANGNTTEVIRMYCSIPE